MTCRSPAAPIGDRITAFAADRDLRSFVPLLAAVHALEGGCQKLPFHRRAHDPELLSDQYQLGQRLNLKLLHYVVAMGLDRPLGRPQLVGDLLVEFAAYDQGEDLSLSRSEGGDEGTQGGKPFTMFSRDLL